MAREKPPSRRHVSATYSDMRPRKRDRWVGRMDGLADGCTEKRIKRNGDWRIQLVSMRLFTPKVFQLFICWKNNVRIKLGKGTG